MTENALPVLAQKLMRGEGKPDILARRSVCVYIPRCFALPSTSAALYIALGRGRFLPACSIASPLHLGSASARAAPCA
jgi:hypothetical protein